MENDFAKLKKRSLLSIFSLFFQSGYAAILGLITNLTITIILSKETFGIYFTVLSIISILNYFSDIGLAASLIQKKEINDDDIKTTFTIQQSLIIVVLIIGYLSTSFIQNFYKLAPDAVHLYWALLFSFFISSLKTIPSILIERQIKFQKIVVVQIVENTLFYLTVLSLAILGFNIQSFTYAVIVRSVAGLILIYSISFWKPKIGFSLKSAKELLKFGIPFQSTSFLALFKDDLITLYLAKVLGFGGIGYIGWAKKWAEAPLRIIMDNLSKVLFPVLARLQHDKSKIGHIIEKILYHQSLIVLPATIGIAFVITTLVKIIPGYSKWAPALPYFYLFCLSALLSSFSTPFTNLFNSLGKVKISFFLMLFWTTATWILTPVLTKMYGLYGFPITQVILAMSFILVVSLAKKFVQFNFLSSVIKPIVASLIMGILLSAVLVFFDRNILSLVLTGIVGATSYYLIFLLLFKINLVRALYSLFTHE